MLNNKSLFLAIDQGGHASRVMAFNLDGEPVAQAQHTIKTLHPQSTHVEHNARQIIDSIQASLAKVAADLGEKIKYVERIGLATQRSNIVCWDKHSGEPLSPVISWQDTRANNWLKQLSLDREDIHKTTGLFPSAHYGASKMRWCLDNLDAVQQAAQQDRLCMGPMSSYIVFALCRNKPFVSDPVSASRTLLWNIHRKDWDDYLLKSFNIERRFLPQCVTTEYEYGDIHIGERDIPLSIVDGDQSAALYAYGNLQYETAYINLGTGAFISRPSGYALLYARRLLTSVIYSYDTDSHYVLEGTVNGAGSALDWVQQARPCDDLWDKLPDWLQSETDPPLFLNGISGLAAPYWIADFKTSFLDGKQHSDASHYVSVIESIVFLLNANVQEMMKFASPPQQIQITGGLSRLDGLCQRLADLTRLPAYRPKECEATARGIAYLLAGKPLYWPEQTHGEWFQPRDNAVLDQRFLLWETAMLECMRKD